VANGAGAPGRARPALTFPAWRGAPGGQATSRRAAAVKPRRGGARAQELQEALDCKWVAAEAAEALRAVFQALHAAEPRGGRYLRAWAGVLLRPGARHAPRPCASPSVQVPKHRPSGHFAAYLTCTNHAVLHPFDEHAAVPARNLLTVKPPAHPGRAPRAPSAQRRARAQLRPCPTQAGSPWEVPFPLHHTGSPSPAPHGYMYPTLYPITPRALWDRAQVMKVEAGCLALEQAAVGAPDEPVPGDLEGGPGCAPSMQAAFWQRCTSPHKEVRGCIGKEKRQSASQKEELDCIDQVGACLAQARASAAAREGVLLVRCVSCRHWLSALGRLLVCMRPIDQQCTE